METMCRFNIHAPAIGQLENSVIISSQDHHQMGTFARSHTTHHYVYLKLNSAVWKLNQESRDSL